MGTRGFIGVKKDGKIKGFYNGMDSYYSSLGQECLDAYYADVDFFQLNESKQDICEEGDYFITDGLYCEYAYVHNLDNDTLEIYRGFFKKSQWTKEHYTSHDGTKYYTHIVTVIDKNIHEKKEVLEFLEYCETLDNEEKEYPEREKYNICEVCFKIIKVGEKTCSKKCEEILILRSV